MKFLIAIKSSKLENLNTVYNFITALIKKNHTKISMVFFYKDGSYALCNPGLTKLINILPKHSVPKLTVCNASCKRRGINIIEPFKSSSIIEFIDACETADRVIHF